MNKEQQVLLSLLEEVDRLCTKNKIEYYLAPRLAVHAVYGDEMPKSPLAGGILMKLSDMERFRLAYLMEEREDRALESMYENKRFPGFFLRYEDKNSLCFRMDEGRNYEYPGIGIDIYPLRGKESSRKLHLWLRCLEMGWIQFCHRKLAQLLLDQCVIACLLIHNYFDIVCFSEMILTCIDQ